MTGVVRVVVSLKHLKFHKQKFYPEFQVELIEAIETSNDSMFQDDEYDNEIYENYEEHPVPSYEEVMSIKEECIASLKKECDGFADKIREFEDLYKAQFEKLTYLQNCVELSEIVELCEEYQN